MATATYIRGERCPVAHVVSGSAVAVDQIVIIGRNLGVAMVAGAVGDTIEVDLTGAYEFPKLSAAAIAAGEPVDYDLSAGEVDDSAMTAAAGDLSDFGFALETRAATTTTVKVQLTPNTATIGS
jgi:predicted RecA/RadA family phage recombinase